MIDSDALLTVYNPMHPPCEELGLGAPANLNQRMDTYLNFVLLGGREIALTPWQKAIGGFAAPGSNLQELIDNFDTTYFNDFVKVLVPGPRHPRYDYALLRAYPNRLHRPSVIYAQARCN